MTRIITDASLLSLSGLFLKQDVPCLKAGAHLRWWISPDLGLPRTGFRLRRRPASQWPWPKHEALDAYFNKATVATSVAGVHVRDAPLRVEKAVVTASFSLRCDRRRPMRFLYEQRQQDDLQFQPFIRFAVILKCPSPTAIIVLRAFTKRDGADIQISEQRARFGSLPYYYRPGSAERAIFVSASEIHRVELEAPDHAEVVLVRFVTPPYLHGLGDWEHIGLFTPLCEPGTPNAASPDNVRTLAADRLAANRPRRRPGDPGMAGAGRLLTMADHNRFENALMADAEALSTSISRAFRLEMEGSVLPGRITLDDVDSGQISSDDGIDDGRIDLPFYAVLQAGAFAPHVAAILGLAHHDRTADGDAVYDYAVDALTPSMWLALGLLPPEVAEKTKIPPMPKLDFGSYPDHKAEVGKEKDSSGVTIHDKVLKQPIQPVIGKHVIKATIAQNVQQARPMIADRIKTTQKDSGKTVGTVTGATEMVTGPKIGRAHV